MDQRHIENKWNNIYQKTDLSIPADVLVENSFLLPAKGLALDLASGLGANALFMAEQGLTTHAWDISTVALKKLQQNAIKKGLEVATKQVFIDKYALPKKGYDVIVLSRFLDRSLCNAIMACLKPSGLLFYQTYVRDKIASHGPQSPAFLLDRNELINLFSPLKLIVYRENSRVGDLAHGERNEALFVGQKS